MGTDGWPRSVRCCLDVTCRSTAMSLTYVVFINTDKSTGTFIINYYHLRYLFREQGKAVWQRSSHCEDLSTLLAEYHQCGLSSMNTAGVALAAVGSNGCWPVCTSVQKYHAFVWFIDLLFKATNYSVNEICLKPMHPQVHHFNPFISMSFCFLALIYLYEHLHDTSTALHYTAYQMTERDIRKTTLVKS